MIVREENVRDAILEDLAGIMRLLHQLSPEEVSADPEQLRQKLEHMIIDENYVIIVCEQDGNLIGTASLIIMPNLTHQGKSAGSIQNVVTDVEHRGKGIGLAMVKRLIDIAKEKNCYKAILDCEEKNIAFYEKCGLHKTGEVEMRIDL